MPRGTTPCLRQSFLPLERGLLYVGRLTVLLAELGEGLVPDVSTAISPGLPPLDGDTEVEGHLHELHFVLYGEALGLAPGRLQEGLGHFSCMVRMGGGARGDLSREIPRHDRIDGGAADAHARILLRPGEPARSHGAYLQRSPPPRSGRASLLRILEKAVDMCSLSALSRSSMVA